MEERRSMIKDIIKIIKISIVTKENLVVTKKDSQI